MYLVDMICLNAYAYKNFAYTYTVTTNYEILPYTD